MRTTEMSHAEENASPSGQTPARVGSGDLFGILQLKADMFDYLCWLETVRAPEELHGSRFIVFASDGTPVDGCTYADAVRVAMEHDKELYDATAKSVLPNT